MIKTQMARVRPSFLGGEISIPPSKSHTMRALVFALLAKGKSTVRNYLHSPDTEKMINACKILGASIQVHSNFLEIEGNLRPAEDVINVGNSGQILRFIGAVSALTSGYTILTGDHSIRHLRQARPLLEGLEQLGAFAVSSRGDGHAPLIVKGPLKGGTALINGEDSQPLSALLMATPFIPAKTEIFVVNPGELPWIRFTLHWLDRLGIKYEHENFEKYTIFGHAGIDGFDYVIPADWSSASYPIAAALVTNSGLVVRGVDFKDPQGDKNFIFLLKEMGANLVIDEERQRVTLFPGSRLKGKKVDISCFIDAITLLPVIACFAEGTTEITGGLSARKKECDRVHAIVTELKKMGANIEEREDGLIVEKSDLYGAHTKSHDDHRLGMSLTVAALGAKGDTTISGVEVIAKSFPNFFEELQRIGACIE